MTRSIVTGGAGFIGSNLVDVLTAAGHEVLVIDDFSTGHRENLASAPEDLVTVADLDVADGEALATAVDGFAPDVVFHLAAQADVRKAAAEPAFDARVNVIGTVNALEAARRNDSAFVFAATGGAVYGEGDGRTLPFAETATPAPETAYGVSKLAGEHYVDLYRRMHGVPAAALRFANVYGPRQDPHGEAGVVAIMCGRLLSGEAATVFGDGTQTRDYVFVADTVAAIVAAADQLLGGGAAPRAPLNVGTGVETSVLDLLERLGSVSGTEVAYKLAAARPGEVRRVAIDPAAASETLGWTPTTGLTEGLAMTLASFETGS